MCMAEERRKGNVVFKVSSFFAAEMIIISHLKLMNEHSKHYRYNEQNCVFITGCKK